MLDRTGTIKKTGALCKFSIFKDNFIMMLLHSTQAMVHTDGFKEFQHGFSFQNLGKIIYP